MCRCWTFSKAELSCEISRLTCRRVRATCSRGCEPPRVSARVGACVAHARSRAQGGDAYAAALCYLRADAFAARGDYIELIALAERTYSFGSPCCVSRRALSYLGLGPVVETVAAGGLEFAAKTLVDHATCESASMCAVGYLVHACRDGRERRALQTGVLPHLITFVKDRTRRLEETLGVHGSKAESEALFLASRALLAIAGSSFDNLPHPAEGMRCVPQPHVVEEILRSGLPRLYLSRAVALAQHAHDVGPRPSGFLSLDAELRATGHVFRACVLVATAPRHRDPRLLMTVVAALRANAHIGRLQLWALRYIFVPLAYAEITRKKGGNVPAFARAGCFACRLECCAPTRSMGNAPETLAALNTAGALPVVIAAAEQHFCCRRFAARLLAYLTQGDAAARKLLDGYGASAAMLRVHSAEQSRWLRLFGGDPGSPTYEKLRELAANSIDAHADADSDATAPSHEDGSCLSDCEADDDGLLANAAEYPLGTPEFFASVAELYSYSVLSHTMTRQQISRAVCALTGAPDVTRAATAHSASAADDCAAALLAEEEAEKAAVAAASQKKKKKKRNKQNKAVAALEREQDASEGEAEEEAEEQAEAISEEALAAGNIRATLAAPPRPFRSPAAAAAAQPPPPPVRQKAGKSAKQRPAQQPEPAAELSHVHAHAKLAPPPTELLLPPLPPLPMSTAPLAVPVPAVPMARMMSQVDELFPWLAMGDDSPPAPPPAGPLADTAHEDDNLCLICLDADRDTALPGCAHPPVLCAMCVVLLRRSKQAACPLCRTPLDADDSA